MSESKDNRGKNSNRRSNNRGGRGRGARGRSGGRGPRSREEASSKDDSETRCRKILVLHGSRQTGQLLLGRMDKLNKALQKECNNIKLIAPDAPFDHPEDNNLRQWWDRHGNEYRGFETSLGMLQEFWESEGSSCIGIMGFSQGARLAHLISLYHQYAKSQNLLKIPFQGLQFAILVAGYDAPIPDNWSSALQYCMGNRDTIEGSEAAAIDFCRIKISTPSLHVWGAKDALVLPEQSQLVMQAYACPTSHEHEGGHHVPMKPTSISAYVDFVVKQFSSCSNEKLVDVSIAHAPASGSISSECRKENTLTPTPSPPKSILSKEIQVPDEETAQAQQDEVEALKAIYPEEVTMVSKVFMNEETGENTYKHPISYRIALHPEQDSVGGHWPPRPLSLGVKYPHNYPSDEALPEIKLIHDNNVMQWSSGKSAACLKAIQDTAEAERGMPCILSCLYAAREFLDSGEEIADLVDEDAKTEEGAVEDDDNSAALNNTPVSSLLKQASMERIQQCNIEGLSIAEELLGRAPQTVTNAVIDDAPLLSGKGGSWLYTIGLVGKPSAGKSTFFNTASAFARQRDDADNVLGGATMAPHPFTTIDPNIGFCLVPAPKGSCPEEALDKIGEKKLNIGSSHGRDSQGRRLLPVLLKDVAGLVPGAYQGRGRGNKFLNDLTDADVLVHVVDSSGKADSEGNVIANDDDDYEQEQNLRRGDLMPSSQPLNDLAWIRNELIEWVFANLMFKWESVLRKGRSRLWGMFSGYGQTQAVVTDVLLAVEKHMEKVERREKALDRIEEWDTGDVHRLVSAFLGVRFPMALALNKYDMPSSSKHVKAIQEALPIHGAHVGVPLSARSEMNFIRYHLLQSAKLKAEEEIKIENEERRVPLGTWNCLQAAISLREPVLVFPVSDMATYQPLSGMQKYATGDPSLPSAKMIACLQSSGGTVPSLWDTTQGIYVNNASRHDKNQPVLRDVLIMKPGSTVDDVFNSLKRLGALSGEFVRAEGAGAIGEKPKLIPKSAMVGKHNRILKVMTTKRAQWQQQHAAQSK